eukprot:TRINITY_DN10247_c0_g1_i6.p2 TRINITY_DN10247_c0_g1~~TRINITY_DN10247_c0_g1_i6.p2  ORF type:complete len:471 (-),score=45.51 TRINITY_DN10247_c0_g1_i6:2072-3484(-)
MEVSGGPKEQRCITLSTTLTLVLATLGSSVLPIAFAFSRTGVLMGLVLMFIVAICNDYTSYLLLRASYILGTRHYEDLAFKTGGTKLKIITHLSLVILLFGNLCGDFALVADVGKKVLIELCEGEENVPQILIGGDGRGIMIIVSIVIILPLCMLPKMRQLDKAGSVGIILVFFIIVAVVYRAIQLGIPGISSNEVPLFAFRIDWKLPEAFSVLGFSFYLQPMLLPLYAEMPRGAAGLQITIKAVHYAVLCVATLVYSLIGIFGAAAFGSKTAGDILINQLFEGKLAMAVIEFLILIYLAVSLPPVLLALRCTVETLFVGADAPFSLRRFLLETFGIFGVSLGVTCFFSGYAEKFFAFTGATGVCLVCYVIPFIIHFSLWQRKRQYVKHRSESNIASLLPENNCQIPDKNQSFEQQSQLLDPLLDKSSYGSTRTNFVDGLALPMLTLFIGVSFSVAALFVWVRKLVLYAM